jgi:hypothetical protein
MAKFRKKPVVIEAVQYTGDEESQRAIHRFAPGKVEGFFDHDYFLNVYTLEGTMRADPGDWIIKGIQGEFYPCKPDIFEETYDPVDE